MTAAEIAGCLGDGLRSLYDIFQDVFPAWNVTSLPFTLAGNTTATNFVALPADFQAELGLNWLNPPGIAGPVSVPRLGTWQDRNRGNILATPVSGALFMRREYAAQGDNLIVYPYYQSAGSYSLDYVPQVPTLSETPGTGLITQLPTNITPWRLYLITFASISVKVKREEETQPLQLRLNQEAARARKAAELRSQQTIKQIQIGGPGLGLGGYPGDWTNGTGGDWWW
ncbi:MAG TPA: hypothetical protein VLZ78_07865 [Terrimesophilobacter sp.]|nr:hypothetical protein [Terrimesophilobacter sp.]